MPIMPVFMHRFSTPRNCGRPADFQRLRRSCAGFMHTPCRGALQGHHKCAQVAFTGPALSTSYPQLPRLPESAKKNPPCPGPIRTKRVSQRVQRLRGRGRSRPSQKRGSHPQECALCYRCVIRSDGTDASIERQGATPGFHRINGAVSAAPLVAIRGTPECPTPVPF